MDDTSNAGAESNPPPSDPASPTDGYPPKGDVGAAHDRASFLLSVIEEQASAVAAKSNDIEQGRLHAEKARTEIDAELSAVKEMALGLKAELESAKSLSLKVISLQNSAQKTSGQTIEVKAKADAALESMHAMIETVTQSGSRVEAIKVAAEESQGIVATKSEHIENARLHADKSLAEIDRLVAEAQSSSVNAEAQHQNVRTTHGNVSAIYGDVQTLKANTSGEAEAVSKLRAQCEEHVATSKKLADISAAAEERIAAYEARLAELGATADARLKTIEHLLPGATSAGLASAFNQRRLDFWKPQVIWQGTFVICLLGLIGIALWEFSLFPETATWTWDKLGLTLARRLPYAVPLIWLAIHASHKAALAQRVEEDYAFKETVSRSFEGYRREMAELEGKTVPESALSRLCVGVLAIITDPPGRIYEKHHLTKTPLNTIADSAGPIGDVASKMTPQIKFPPPSMT